jgi:hypothetical protein
MLRKTHVYDRDVEICRGRVLWAVGSSEDDDVISEDTNPMQARPQSDHSIVASLLGDSMLSSAKSASASISQATFASSTACSSGGGKKEFQVLATIREWN